MNFIFRLWSRSLQYIPFLFVLIPNIISASLSRCRQYALSRRRDCLLPRGCSPGNPRSSLATGPWVKVSGPGWTAEHQWWGQGGVRGAASLPATEVLINQAESCRGSPLAQAFRRELSRTRANPFFILPADSFLLEVLLRRPGACALVSLWAVPWVCLGRGLGLEGGGRTPHSPFLPPFSFVLLSLIMKY